MSSADTSTWVGRNKSPKVSEQINSILKKYGYDATNFDQRESFVKVASAAYLAGYMAIAEQQPYFSEADSFVMRAYPISAATAMYADLTDTKKIPESKAHSMAEAFEKELHAKCQELAAHYKPKAQGQAT